MNLPAGLPAPKDDGACAHLPGMAVPPMPLAATDGGSVDLSRPCPGITVVYVYPRTGRPGSGPTPGWDQIPGARGCTPESCGFRDHYGDLKRLGVRVYGLSAQSTDDQLELVRRLRLPFPVLSDGDLSLARALGLPTFEFNGMTLIKRLTLIIRDGRIDHVFYPVFPPDTHAGHVVGWITGNPA